MYVEVYWLDGKIIQITFLDITMDEIASIGDIPLVSKHKFQSRIVHVKELGCLVAKIKAPEVKCI